MTTEPHGYDIGSQLSLTITEPDIRWWRRAWFFITGRQNPTREVKYGATGITETTLLFRLKKHPKKQAVNTISETNVSAR
jgi:hypothetical protein